MENTVNSSSSRPDRKPVPDVVMKAWAREVRFSKCQSDMQALLYYLVMMANAKYECWPGNRHLMEVFNVTEPTIIKRLKWLDDSGLISRTTMSSPRGRKRTVIRLSVGADIDLPPCTGSPKHPKLKKDPNLKNQVPLTKKIGDPTLKPDLSKEDIEEDREKIFREEMRTEPQGIRATTTSKTTNEQGTGDKGAESTPPPKVPSKAVLDIVGKYAAGLYSQRTVMALWYALLRHFHPQAPDAVLKRKKLPSVQFYALMALLQDQNLSAVFSVAYLVENWRTVEGRSKWPSPAYLESNVEFVESWEQEYPEFSSTLFRLELEFGIETRLISPAQLELLTHAVASYDDPLKALSASGAEAPVDLLSKLDNSPAVPFTGRYRLYEIVDKHGLLALWEAETNLCYRCGEGGIPFRQMPRDIREVCVDRLLAGDEMGSVFESVCDWWDKSGANPTVQELEKYEPLS